MFQVKANPTFEATLDIVGQGREQKLNVTFKHKPASEWDAALAQVRTGEKPAHELLLEIIEAWDADVDLNADGVKLLEDSQPGISWAIFIGYRDALTVSRKGN